MFVRLQMDATDDFCQGSAEQDYNQRTHVKGAARRKPNRFVQKLAEALAEQGVKKQDNSERNDHIEEEGYSVIGGHLASCDRQRDFILELDAMVRSDSCQGGGLARGKRVAPLSSG